MGSGADPTLGTGPSIGRYFSVVSVLPSVLLACWLYLVLASGGATDGPSLTLLAENAPTSHPVYLAATLAAAIAVAVVSHPLQFGIVQLFEGYWPNNSVARRIRTALVMGHLNRLSSAYSRKRSADLKRSLVPTPESGDLNQYLAPKRLPQHFQSAEIVVETQMDLESWDAVEAAYPSDKRAILPTMLGNTLRKHELAAGAAVHLPILHWATHIGMVADATHTRYVNDQRTQVDLAVRVSAFCYIGAAATFVILWSKGWSVLLSLIPYFAGMLSYKGAVIAANGYGAALHAWVDLNRRPLYQSLGLRVPESAQEERLQNDALKDLLVGNDTYTAKFRWDEKPKAVDSAKPAKVTQETTDDPPA